MATGGKKRPRVAELTEQERKALDLRIEGNTFDAIGKILSISRTRAYQVVTDALRKSDEAMASKGARHRELEAQRLDALLRAQWPLAKNGDEKAARLVLALMERRAKLLALDLPQKVDVTSGGQPITTSDAFAALAKALADPPDGGAGGAAPSAGGGAPA